MRSAFLVIGGLLVLLLFETASAANRASCQIQENHWSVSFRGGSHIKKESLSKLIDWKVASRRVDFPFQTVSFESDIEAHCISDDNVLFVEQAYMSTKVYLDDELVYAYDGSTPPSRHHIVSLKPVSESEEAVRLRIETYSWANATGLSGAVQLMSKDDAYVRLIQDSLFRFSVVIILLAFGVFSIFLWIFRKSSVDYLFFGLFSVSFSMFLFKFVELSNYAFLSPKNIIRINIIGLLAAPAAFAFLANSLLRGPKGKRLIRTIGVLLTLEATAFLGMNLGFDVGYREMFQIHTGISALAGLNIVLISVAYRDKTEKNRALYFSFSVLVGVVLIATLEELGFVSLPYDFFFASALLFVSSFAMALAQKFYLVYLTGIRNEKLALEANLELEKSLVELRQAKVHEAVSRMTSAISHDVRKPFSLFKAVLDGIKEATNPAELQEFAAMTLPEIERAMHSVDGLLTDVLQVSSTSNELVLEDLNVAKFINTCYLEMFRAQPEADVSIESNFELSLAIAADEAKLRRVFLNILGNACQASQWKGRIWVHARSENGRVHFVLGNAGSFIPSESLPQLFEAYFTSGKKGGTGLGLAIAKKWTEAHGGKISCVSVKDIEHPDGIVEFHFDIKEAASKVEAYNAGLPVHSSAYKIDFSFGKNEAGSLAGQLAQVLAVDIGPQKLKIAALDDEPVYLRSIEGLVRSLDSAGNLTLQTRTNGFSANLLEEIAADLFILDFDLGLPDLNGLDLIRSYRNVGGSGHICLHTNRADSETSCAAIKAGANTVYPKPIDAKHLVNLLGEVAQKKRAAMVATEKPVAQKLRVALIEDSLVMRLSWRVTLANYCELSEFKLPEDFIAKASGTYDFIITDMNFGGSAFDGVQVARFAKENKLTNVVFLSSGADFNDVESLFQRQLDKNHNYTFQELTELLK